MSESCVMIFCKKENLLTELMKLTEVINAFRPMSNSISLAVNIFHMYIELSVFHTKNSKKNSEHGNFLASLIPKHNQNLMSW